ncbi:MAG: sensor histidine kinase [Chitinophagaceae bacterium]
MYDLIFSNNWSQRIKRHLLFWAVVYIYQVVRMSFLFPPDQIWVKVPLILIIGLTWGIFHLMLITYSVVYYLVPKLFMKRKYVLFGISVLILFIIVFGFNVAYMTITKPFTHAVGITKEQPYIFLRGTIIRLFGNAPLICGLLLSLKTLKTWHQKQLENEILTREKANAELQLLKAQIHPHFLFNTLNNIYSFTLTKSPLAAELVQKLSDMLGYMITDCESIMVPLEKEIQLLKDYIGLEKIRYGNRLDIRMHINGECKSKMIAPLLMIPFVENCFKHGASIMRGKQWMQLSIHVNNYVLYFNLTNRKPLQPVNTKSKNGIGLLNVKKRLALLYPDKHQLIINPSDGVYNVQLQIELQMQMATEEKRRLTTSPILTYS